MNFTVAESVLSLIIVILFLLHLAVTIKIFKSTATLLEKILLLMFLWGIPVIGLLSFFLVAKNKNTNLKRVDITT